MGKLEIQNNKHTSAIVSHLESIISSLKTNLDYIYSKSTDETKHYINNMFDTDIEFYKHVKTGNKYIDSVILAKYYFLSGHKISLNVSIYKAINELDDDTIYKIICLLDKYINYFAEDYILNNSKEEYKKVTIVIDKEEKGILVKVFNNLNEERSTILDYQIAKLPKEG